MFARISEIKMRRGKSEDAAEVIRAMREKVVAMSGFCQLLILMDDDNTGKVITIWDSKAALDANAAMIAQMWGNFAPFMTAIPSAEGYDVLANWTD